eukprot:4445149-Pleurochrysis_carterae.AAC.1
MANRLRGEVRGVTEGGTSFGEGCGGWHGKGGRGDGIPGHRRGRDVPHSKNITCNTTFYKRDTCYTKWHRVETFEVPAKATTNIRSMLKVANMFPTHQRL